MNGFSPGPLPLTPGSRARPTTMFSALISKLQSMLHNSLWRAAAHNLLLILIWYILSTVLGLYNKKLLGKEHGLHGKGAFPAPLLMSAVQFLLQYVLARLVFLARLMDRVKEKPVSWPDYWRIVAPNGVLTGLDIGFSNKSLVYITMSFYTMCKSTVPIWLLLCAFIWRIERPSWELAGVVLVICCGLALLVAGEAAFDLLGFMLVMSAASCSGVRFTLTQVSLHGHGDAVSMGGPLEVLELLTPIMSITSLLLSLSWEQLWHTLPGSPYFDSVASVGVTLGLIGIGALIAFLMVWTEYKVIKQTSALTFMIAGTCKEVVTVIAAVIVFGDHFGVVNGIGLLVVITGVVLFNVHKYRRMVQGHIPTYAQARHQKLEEADDGTELEPLVVAASGAQQPSAPGLTVNIEKTNASLEKLASSSARTTPSALDTKRAIALSSPHELGLRVSVVPEVSSSGGSSVQSAQSARGQQVHERPGSRSGDRSGGTREPLLVGGGVSPEPDLD